MEAKPSCQQEGDLLARKKVTFFPEGEAYPLYYLLSILLW
jgi:hypothetical protein